jgi:hypothetical protein
MTATQSEGVREALINILHEYGIEDILDTVVDVIENDEEFEEGSIVMRTKINVTSDMTNRSRQQNLYVKL